MTTTPSDDHGPDGRVVHPDGLVVGDRPILRMRPDGHVDAVCDPDDPDDPAWQPSAAPAVRCALYRPGHNVHWIQARKALRTPAVPYLLVTAEGQWADLVAPTGELCRWRFHDTNNLVALLLLEGPSTVHLHEYGLLRAGRSLLYPCSGEQEWTDCSPGRPPAETARPRPAPLAATDPPAPAALPGVATSSEGSGQRQAADGRPTDQAALAHVAVADPDRYLKADAARWLTDL